MSDIKNYLVKQAKPGKWLFPEQVWTDQNAEQIITKAVQAKLLDFLPQEIPYHLKAVIEYFDMDEKGKKMCHIITRFTYIYFLGAINTAVTINCPTERIARLVAGASDGKLKQITESLQQDLQNTFQNYVRIRLILQPSKTI